MSSSAVFIRVTTLSHGSFHPGGTVDRNNSQLFSKKIQEHMQASGCFVKKIGMVYGYKDKV